ncbi:MAG: lytic transglycosylase domain-containing protein [Victivallales bacterium]|nr:lytic transglycosylase domain-containing protein [Victivallales bacterium]
MYTEIIRRRNKWKKNFVLCLLVTFAALLAWVAFRHYKPFAVFLGRPDYGIIIEDAAKRHGVDPPLLKALIWQESRFKPNATGRHGEIGLMQIRPEFGAVTDWEHENKVKVRCKGLLYQPELNIEIGAWYLGRALRRWSEYKFQHELALSEYNAGLHGMQPWVPGSHDGDVMEKITIPSTRAYISNIMLKYQEYAECRQAE